MNNSSGQESKYQPKKNSRTNKEANKTNKYTHKTHNPRRDTSRTQIRVGLGTFLKVRNQGTGDTRTQGAGWPPNEAEAQVVLFSMYFVCLLMPILF